MNKNYKIDFPLLQKYKNLIYFDNAATSQKPVYVLEKMHDFYVTTNAPVGRSLYPLAEQATQDFARARATIAAFINAYPEEIIFTPNATQSLNFIASTWGLKNLKKGDEIVLSELEHHSNLIPWQECAKQTGSIIRFIPVHDKGTLDYTNLESIITSKTKLVSFIDISNALGTCVDREPLVKRARQVGARILIDACQSVPHKKVDVKAYDCDFLVFSGHKMLGPTGIGVLYIKKNVWPEVPPYQFGGGMVFDSSYISTRFLEPPHCYEAGTPPVAQAVGLAAAVEYLNMVDFSWLKKHEASLCERTIEGLQKIPGFRILGQLNQLKEEGHLISFLHEKYHAHDIAAYLGSKNIAVRAGHYCAQPLARKMNVEGSVRLSFYLYNSLEQVDQFLWALKKLQ